MEFVANVVEGGERGAKNRARKPFRATAAFLWSRRLLNAAYLKLNASQRAFFLFAADNDSIHALPRGPEQNDAPLNFQGFISSSATNFVAVPGERMASEAVRMLDRAMSAPARAPAGRLGTVFVP
jgi:hypothetical protein